MAGANATDRLDNMADNDDLGLTQEDIDAALAEASDGAASSPPPQTDAGSGAEASSSELGDSVSQDDIDAALAQAESAASQIAGEGEAAPAADDAPPELDSMGRPFDEAAAMMAAAITEEKAAAAAAAPPEMPSFNAEDADPELVGKIDLLNDVQLHVKIELGRSRMLVEEVLKLGDGSVVELDKLAGDPVDLYVNERLVARGEVLVLNDNFCVRISEIISRVEEEEVMLES